MCLPETAMRLRHSLANRLWMRRGLLDVDKKWVMETLPQVWEEDSRLN